MEMEQPISQIEQALDLAFRALLSDDAQALVTHAQAVLTASQRWATGAAEESLERRRAVAQRVQLLREAIARKQSLNGLALQQLVPAFQQPTYAEGAVAGARPGATPYAAGLARPSGRLNQTFRA